MSVGAITVMRLMTEVSTSTAYDPPVRSYGIADVQICILAALGIWLLVMALLKLADE